MHATSLKDEHCFTRKQSREGRREETGRLVKLPNMVELDCAASSHSSQVLSQVSPS